MALIGTYGTGSVLSKAYSTLDELIIQIPDNVNNEIDASDIRDSVYSLWYRVDGLSSSVVGLTANNFYVGLTPSTITSPIGGILPGATFSGTIQGFIDQMLYPYVSPTSIFTSVLSDREFGSSLSISLAWSVTKGSSNISSISISGSGASITPTGNSQTGTTIRTATHSVSPSGPSQSTTFVLSVSDGTTTTTATNSVYYMNYVYWGSLPIPSYPNLTENPGSASLAAAVCTDSNIKLMNGSGANGLAYGKLLSVTKNRSFLGINGSNNTPGEYLVFAWPSTVSGALTPKFMVNGMINNAFTRVRTSSPFVNNSGFNGVTYEVWVSNTRYFSPVDVIIS